MTRTAHELANFLTCALEGDGTVQLSGVAAPDSATATDLIYVEKARHSARAAASQARCVVIAPELSVDGKTLLRAANPKLAFARAAAWLVPPLRLRWAFTRPPSFHLLHSLLAASLWVPMR